MGIFPLNEIFGRWKKAGKRKVYKEYFILIIIMEQKLLPPGYEEYNDIIRVASSPVKPIERLKKVYYQFDLDEVKVLLEKVKKSNEKKSFLLESEIKFLDKFIYVVKHLKDHQKRIHFIKIEDCMELIGLSLKATFDRVLDILNKVMDKTIGKKSSLIEDKIIFSIRSNLRLIEILQEEDIDIANPNKFQRILSDFDIVLRNIISINASVGLEEEEANALLDDIISETSNIWSSYKKLKDFEVPKTASQTA